MNRRRAFVFGTSILLPLAALAHFGCVGDAPVTPGVDGGSPDVGGGDVAADVAKDGGADSAVPLLACQPNETLETFDDPMGGGGVKDFCFNKSYVSQTCVAPYALSYAAGTLTAAATPSVSDGFAFADRSMDLGTTAAAALVTFELSITGVSGSDGGTFSGLGCFIDLDNANDAGVATSISRIDLATDDKALYASTWTSAQPNRLGGTRAAIPGFTLVDPITVTISVDHRSAPVAKFDVASKAGSGSVSLNPATGSIVAMSCGADRIGVGETKVTIRKIRYARCVAK
jgi:hypothetical protein